MTKTKSKITVDYDDVNDDDPYMHISCAGCGNGEGQPIDQQRSHLQTFSFNYETDTYSCGCGETITEKEIDDAAREANLKYEYVCCSCDSNNIYRETVQSWDSESESWLVDGVNNYLCNECGKHNVDPKKTFILAIETNENQGSYRLT